MLAAARPLPRDDTTPPVMKMYLGVRSMILSTGCGGREQLAHLLQVFRGVHFERFVRGFDDLDADAVLQGAQLLERLGSLERGGLEGGQHQQDAAAIRVEADMSIERRPAAARVADVRNRGAREIQGKAAAIDDHL